MTETIQGNREAPLLQIDSVVLRIGNREILSGVSAEIPHGAVVGLIGANGSGKSSLLNVVSGYYRMSSGRVALGDEDISSLSSFAIGRLGVGRSFQTMTGIERLTVREYVQLGADLLVEPKRRGLSRFIPITAGEWRSRALAADLVDRCGLAAAADTPLGLCPYGLRKIADVARVFAAAPRVVLLDEPTSGVGRASAARIGDLCRELVAAGDCGVLVVDHDMRFIDRCCDLAVALAGGTVIAAGTPGEVMRQDSVRDTLLGRGAPADSDAMSA